MRDDILSIIEYKMPTFSKGQKRIAALICEAYDRTAFMTAGSLGKLAGVSEATVVRFAAELGYSGYPQMQKAMQAVVRSRLSSQEGAEGMQDVLSTVLQSDAKRLLQSNDILDRTVFQGVLQDILKAKSIYIIGDRADRALAEFLGYYLQQLFDGVYVIPDGTAGQLRLCKATARDAVIVFGFPACDGLLQAAAYCHSVGAAVIGITDSCLSPLAAACTHVLTVKSDKLACVDSLTAPMSLIAALIADLAARREDALQESRQRLERLRQAEEEAV